MVSLGVKLPIFMHHPIGFIGLPFHNFAAIILRLYMEKLITNIVFTKNRPLQLDAYLGSLYRYFPVEKIQTYIIYKPELFSEEYESLFGKYSNCRIVRENDFHTDCLNIINQADTKYILFGIDDVVFFDSSDFDLIDETFKQFSKDIFGFSLRFSEQNIKKSDHVSKADIASQPVYSINWSGGQTPSTRYPFELCATIYKTVLVKKIIKNSRENNRLCEKLFAPNSIIVKLLSKIIKKHKILKKFGYFYNPNTLESWNCRWCQNHAEKLPQRIYFQKLCASAIQVNIVNTSTLNETDGSAELTVEKLMEKYRDGYRFDICALERDKPSGFHCGKECFGLVKSEAK